MTCRAAVKKAEFGPNKRELPPADDKAAREQTSVPLAPARIVTPDGPHGRPALMS